MENQQEYKTATAYSGNHSYCRICDRPLPHPFLSLGNQPLANNLSTSPNAVVSLYPLELTRCSFCSLVQLTHVVPREDLFDNYLYTPSQSATFVKHFTDMAQGLEAKLGLKDGDLVVDIGSNDGLLLSKFREGIRVLGIEPAKNIVSSVETVHVYWSENLAWSIRAECGEAKLITATNVFAHVDNLNSFMHAVVVLLAPDGTFVIEVPGLLEMLQSGTYDLCYHEHLSYLSLSPLIHLFDIHGMEITNVETVPIHGGSLRLFVNRKGVRERQASVGARIGAEAAIGDGLIESFVEKAEKSKQALLAVLKGDRKPTIGYTAPAKATTMIYYCGLTEEDIRFIVDDSPLKQGKYIPGTHIQITAPTDMELYPYIERAVIFAWNLHIELLPKLKGRCAEAVIPMPEVRVVQV